MAEESKIKWIYSSKSKEDLEKRYDQWAGDYDSDLTAGFDYRSPQRATELFARYVPRDARVLDAGAGTGLVGAILAGMGYRNLVAMDLSRGMLEEARKKSVYTELHRMVMGEPLGFPTASFDAVISVGVLTVGHAPASSLDELVRITRPGGHVVYTLRPDVYEKDGFREKHAELEAAGKWRPVEVSEPFQGTPRGEPDIFVRVWVFRV